MMNKIREFDKQISFSMLPYYKHHIVNEIMMFISSCGDFGMSWLVVILITNMIDQWRPMSIDLLAALLAATLIGQVSIKTLVKRKRPCHTYKDVSILVPVPSDFSFPSGHTASCFACSTVLLFYNPIFALFGFIYSFLTAFSRIYLFVHYVSDVVAGMVLGISVGILICIL